MFALLLLSLLTPSTAAGWNVSIRYMLAELATECFHYMNYYELYFLNNLSTLLCRAVRKHTRHKSLVGLTPFPNT